MRQALSQVLQMQHEHEQLLLPRSSHSALGDDGQVSHARRRVRQDAGGGGTERPTVLPKDLGRLLGGGDISTET